MTTSLDAPVTTIEYDADETRPLQDIPTTEFKARWEQVALAIFIVVPLLAVAAAGFVVWGNGLSITDIVLSVVFYLVAIHIAFAQPWVSAAIYVGVALIWLVPDPRIEKRLQEHA